MLKKLWTWFQHDIIMVAISLVVIVFKYLIQVDETNDEWAKQAN